MPLYNHFNHQIDVLGIILWRAAGRRSCGRRSGPGQIPALSRSEHPRKAAKPTLRWTCPGSRSNRLWIQNRYGPPRLPAKKICRLRPGTAKAPACSRHPERIGILRYRRSRGPPGPPQGQRRCPMMRVSRERSAIVPLVGLAAQVPPESAIRKTETTPF